MTRRSQTPSLDILEDTTAPMPVDAIPPPGVPAQHEHKIRWQSQIDPANVPAQARNFSDELRELASEENPAAMVLDPLTEFCEAWSTYSGCLMSVTRLPDPATRRTPGRQYNMPCLEIEAIGTIPFDPNNIVNDLQIANGNSGGAFRLYLRDHNGQLIEGGYLDRILIPDPPRDPRARRRSNNDYDYDDDRPRYRERESATPPPPQKSETELMVESAQRQLFTTALSRALDPPKQPEPVNPISQLSAEDQLAFGLLKNGNTLQTVIEKIATITQQPDRIDPTPSWKDKGMDAVVHLVTTNPQVVGQVTDIITRAATAVLSAFAPRTAPIINEPMPVNPPSPVQHHPPAQRTQAAIPAQAVSGLPETSQPEDEPFEDDDPELIMLEEITKLLLSDEPLRLNDPVILELRAEFPQQFDTALAAIATAPSGMVVQYICRKSDFAAKMFNSGVTGPHLRNRLDELKQLIKTSSGTATAANVQEDSNDEVAGESQEETDLSAV